MKRAAVGWYDYEWNPFTGCKFGCSQCAPRQRTEGVFEGAIRLNRSDPRCKIEDGIMVLDEPWKTERGVLNSPFGFMPTLHRYRLPYPQTVKVPSNIGVCMMGDLFDKSVPGTVINEVMDACEAAPQHNYLFLTCSPNQAALMMSRRQHDNWWLGYRAITKKVPFAHLKNSFVYIEGPQSIYADHNADFLVYDGDSDDLQKKALNLETDSMTVWTKAHPHLPDALHHAEKISAAQHNRWYGNCLHCSAEHKCSDMVLLMARFKRNTYGEKVGYICKECYPMLTGLLKGEYQWLK